jgi:hypothetical protein
VSNEKYKRVLANHQHAIKDERRLVVLMALVFYVVSLALLYIGASQIGISLSMMQKIAVFPSSKVYLTSYGFFFTGMLGATFTVFLYGIYFSPDRNIARAAGYAGVVLGILLILFAIYSGFVFATVGGFVLGASMVMTIYARDK